jgi:phosphatidylglycerophosphate synthase
VSDCFFTLKTEEVVLVCLVDVVFSLALARALEECLTRSDVPAVYVPGIPLAVVRAGLLTAWSCNWWHTVGQSPNSFAFAPDGYFVQWLKPGVETAAVEKELVASLANPQDGFLDRSLNRPLSHWLTQRLAPLPVRANHITVLSILVGLVAALFFATDGYFLPVLGALMLQAAAVLDCCDGDLARLRFEESALGHWLDIVGDTLVHLATFVGIAWGVAATEGHKLPLVLGAVLVAGVLPSFALVTYAEHANVASRKGPHGEGRAIAWMLIVFTNRDFSVLILLCALIGALRWFLWGAALGVHVFWITLLWLLWRMKEKH